jgi:hypothetical protein
MHYQDGTQKIIEGQAHYWDSARNGWVNPNNGFVLSEQQLQEMDYMMYSEDGYDLPPEVVSFITAAGLGTVAFPDKPRRAFKDYNRIQIEIQAPGGSGGDITQVNNLVGDPKGTSAGGGGAGGYGRIIYNFNRNLDHPGGIAGGTTLTYEIGENWMAGHGVTFIAESIAGDVVARIFPGLDGTTLQIGHGGTAHISANPSQVHFKELTALVGGTGSSGGFVNGSTQGGAGGLPNRLLDNRSTRNAPRGGRSANGLGVTLGSLAAEDAFYYGAGGGGGCTTDANNTQAYNDTLGLTFGGAPGGPFIKVVFYRDDSAGVTGIL